MEQDPLVDANTPIPGQDCVGVNCASAEPPPDWSSEAPTFTAHFQVVDNVGKPAGGVSVRSGERSTTTNRQGFARLGPFPAGEPLSVTLAKDGWTPREILTDVFQSGQTPVHSVLLPLGVQQEIVLEEGFVLSHHGAHLELPAQALIAADGTRSVTGMAELTHLSPDSTPAEALPASARAVDVAGNPTVMDQLLSVTHAAFTSDAGAHLNLAAGQAAMLEVPLPPTSGAMLGAELPMWSLDEASHVWQREQTCTVYERMLDGVSQKVCSGPVTHFSIWAIAEEYDIYRPNALGCINADVMPKEGACFDVWVESEQFLSCDTSGEDCKPYWPHQSGYYAAVGGVQNMSEIDAARGVSYCGVTRTGTFRVELTYRVETSRCAPEEAPLSGRRILRSQPLDLTSFADMLGQDLMLNFTLNGTRDCATLCAQAQFVIDDEALAAPSWLDADGDGSWVGSDPDAEPPRGMIVDCNDANSAIRPGAYEPFCAGVDVNCDGRLPQAASSLEELPYDEWNRNCRQCLDYDPDSPGPIELTDIASMLVRSEEAIGNDYDEDCDGRVDDRDGDGYVSYVLPEDYAGSLRGGDCNDRDPEENPGGKEIPGNRKDEDCDGLRLDQDGDGQLASSQAVHAERLLEEFTDYRLESFSDCDDHDEQSYANAPVETERGQLAAYFYEASDGMHRSVNYCSLFKQSGQPSWQFFRQVRDRNCDGLLTDIDGDGLTAPGDESLGKSNAVDCDDYDPRVGAGVWDPSTKTLQCDPDADASKLLNDSTCTISASPYTPGKTCPTLILSGTSLTTTCEQATDLDRKQASFGVCSFDGWWNTNPLSVHPGQLYGPCDITDGKPLIPCDSGLVCAGLPPGDPLLGDRSPWTQAFSTHISEAYLDGKEIEVKGMCFPGCIVEAEAE